MKRLTNESNTISEDLFFIKDKMEELDKEEIC